MEKDSKTINLVNLIQPSNPPIFQISIFLIKQNRIVSRKFILVLHLTTFYSNFTCLKETSAITIEPRISSTTDEAADFNSVRRVMDVYTRHATSTRREERALFTKKKGRERERDAYTETASWKVDSRARELLYAAEKDHPIHAWPVEQFKGERRERCFILGNFHCRRTTLSTVQHCTVRPGYFVCSFAIFHPSVLVIGNIRLWEIRKRGFD